MSSAATPDRGADPMIRSGSQLKWLWLSLGVILLDQGVKRLAEAQLPPHETVYLFPWFGWYLTYNTGAAFSFLAGAGGWQRWFFTVVAVAISAFILHWLYRLPREERVTALALSLILGGAIGNLIDRLYFGHVIDYIQVWFGSWPFPAFNVADAAISVGAALLILSSFFSAKQAAGDHE